MIKHKNSSNYEIFKNLRTKLRQFNHSREVSYILIFAFFYKYCSDSLKDYLLSVIEDKEITFDETFMDSYYTEVFRNDAFKMFGYYINKPEAYIDEVINTQYNESFFISSFFKAFSENIEFETDSNYEKYFKFVFDAFEKEVHVDKMEYDREYYLIYKDLIYLISKLEIYEDEFSFVEIFNRLCQSRHIYVDCDSDYINYILVELVYASKSSPMEVYNPFLKDGSSLISLADKFPFNFGNSYGMEHDTITYCVCIIKLFMNYFDLDNVFLEFGNAVESVDIDGPYYDVVMSKIPQIGVWKSKIASKTQTKDFAKMNNRRKLEDVLYENFNVSFDEEQCYDALDVLLDNIEIMPQKSSFGGEYESLKDSEYLFLINLINCLKKDGIMVVAIPQSFLFKNSLYLLRKYLIFECNYIDTIISIPNYLGRTNAPEIICIFKKDKMNDNILFVDSSQSFKTKKTSSTFHGMFKRNLIPSDETIEKLIDVYLNKKIIDKYSNVVNISDIADNEFNLSVSRYVDTFEGEFIDLKDLAHEKEEITSNIKKLNKKIDEMMDELDLRFY